jgi:ABC-type sugar transport system ATPase subunit
MFKESLLAMSEISKAYTGVQALDGVNLDVREGEVMALVGENGAGKSTLLKILAGAEIADSGNIFFAGKEISINSPKEASNFGIKVIYQELNLAVHLSVAENIYVGREPKTKIGLVDFKKMQELANISMKEVGLSIDSSQEVNSLSIAQRQLVEIAKALSEDARIVVMDEPTSSLTDQETKILFEIILNLKKKGISVIYVSHRMKEIFEIADRVTILKDGKLVTVKDAKSVSPDEVVRFMIGRELTDLYGQKSVKNLQNVEPIMEVEGLSSDPYFEDISFKVYPGEILVLSGLIGSGRSEAAMTLFGALKRSKGKVTVNGEPFHAKSPISAIRLGIGLLPEDRKKQGLFMQLPVRSNMSSASLRDISRNFVVSRAKDVNLVTCFSEKMGLRANAMNVPAGTLSGGNQQKILLGRWLAKKPKILILDEPTRGVDVLAKSEIYKMIREISDEKVAVVVISSDLMEVLGIADRILIMREGKIVGEVEGQDATESKVMAMATGIGA